MDQVSNAPPNAETGAAHERRFAEEAEMIVKARASAAAGRTVSLEEVEAWVASLGGDQELPRPRSGS